MLTIRNTSYPLDIHTVIVYNSVYMMPSVTTRINISLPEDVLAMLRMYAPERGFSRFLIEAAKEKVDRIRRERAFNELLAAPPTFTNIRNGATYVRRMRRLDEKRAKRLGI